MSREGVKESLPIRGKRMLIFCGQRLWQVPIWAGNNRRQAEKVGVEGQILGVTGFQAECFGLKLWMVGSSEVFKHGVIRSYLPFINVAGAVVV